MRRLGESCRRGNSDDFLARYTLRWDFHRREDRRSVGLRHSAGAVRLQHRRSALRPHRAAPRTGGLHGERRRARAFGNIRASERQWRLHGRTRVTGVRQQARGVFLPPSGIGRQSAHRGVFLRASCSSRSPTDLCLDAPKFQAAWAPPSRMTLEGRRPVVEDRARFGRQRRGRSRARAHLFMCFQPFPLGQSIGCRHTRRPRCRALHQRAFRGALSARYARGRRRA